MLQKEDTFQVVIDVVKNSSCFKAFTFTADVLEIIMHQFWFTIKKVQGIDSYQFLLANKKCMVNAIVLSTILDIYPKVKGVNFTDVLDDDTTLAFLIKMGYKGPTIQAHQHVCGSYASALENSGSNNPQVENVDYPKLIWDDLAYQINYTKEKRSRRENMPFPRFIKVIINHFLKQYNSFSNLKFQHCHTIKEDGIVCRLKFVRIETLILEEESRSKMLDKQNDQISIEKKIKIFPIDYSKLNKIKEDFGKCFVIQKELSAEQAFWLKHSSFSKIPVTSHTPVRIEAPSELPKDTFNVFDRTLLDEITEVQTVFNQMKATVD
nr:hypothetical protein [Tanacetum cinerariifolium]